MRTNEAQDIDVTVAYEAANDPLVAWLAERDRARAKAEEDRAAKEHAAEQQRIARLARKVGPQAAAREDIMGAGLASVTRDRAVSNSSDCPAYSSAGSRCSS
ncbi:hypothetical protein ABT072_42770 [Streptomyces sp. NPDC002589]|uniref:hypothetical protein n=1 Tax=Streptomyces sp. NPDC002589 TaxID=3154420 RepID=UPI00331925D3